jgi:hypothetical protein
VNIFASQLHLSSNSSRDINSSSITFERPQVFFRSVKKKWNFAGGLVHQFIPPEEKGLLSSKVSAQLAEL